MIPPKDRTDMMFLPAPAAPSIWPVIDFVELTSTSPMRPPNAFLIAAVSGTSFKGVPVPCALT
jgi:hypothetical protein